MGKEKERDAFYLLCVSTTTIKMMMIIKKVSKIPRRQQISGSIYFLKKIFKSSNKPLKLV